MIVYPGIDGPGMPAEVLRALATSNTDLTRVGARPSTDEFGDDIFHLDVEHERPDQVVCRLEGVTEWMRYLGSSDLISEQTC